MWTERTLGYGVFLLIALVLSVTNQIVPIHWDEGWNLCCARTLIETGAYGCRFLGTLTSPRMSTGWLSVLPAAAGFSIFGLDYRAARVLPALETFLALWWVWWFGKEFFSIRAGYIALFITLLVTGDPRWSPLALGVQAMGESALMCFLLSGYAALHLSMKGGKGRGLLLLPAAACFALAASAKIQAQPFIAGALTAPVLLGVVQRNRKGALYFLLVSLLTYVAFRLWGDPPLPYVKADPAQGAGSSGIIDTVAWVPYWPARYHVIKFLVFELWFVVLGLVLQLRATWTDLRKRQGSLVLMSMLAFASLWLFWFSFFSINFARYCYAFAFVSSLFLAGVLDRAIGFNPVEGLKGLRARLRRQRPGAQIFVAVFSVLLLTRAAINISGLSSDLIGWSRSNSDLLRMADFVNTETAPHDIVETYDSQVYFLLDRPFHYPPDQWSLSRIRIETGKGGEAVPYDPLAVKPDYLLVGPWSLHVFALYGGVISDPGTTRVAEFGDFRLYRLGSE